MYILGRMLSEWTGALLPTEQKALEIISLSRCWNIHFPLHLQLLWSCPELPFLGRALCTSVEQFLLQQLDWSLCGAAPSLARQDHVLPDTTTVCSTSTSAELGCSKQGDDCTWEQTTPKDISKPLEQSSG